MMNVSNGNGSFPLGSQNRALAIHSVIPVHLEHQEQVDRLDSQTLTLGWGTAMS